MNELPPEAIATLKEHFATSGCEVADMDESNFEVTKDSFPAKTHVFPNPFFLQLTTFVYLRPKSFLGRFEFTRNRFLNEGNQKTNLMKLTCDENKMDELWSIMCQSKITTGIMAFEFTAEAIDHILTLWLQDLAYVVQTDDLYEVIAMIKK